MGWAGGEVQEFGVGVDERVKFGEGNIMSVHRNLRHLVFITFVYHRYKFC